MIQFAIQDQSMFTSGNGVDIDFDDFSLELVDIRDRTINLDTQLFGGELELSGDIVFSIQADIGFQLEVSSGTIDSQYNYEIQDGFQSLDGNGNLILDTVRLNNLAADLQAEGPGIFADLGVSGSIDVAAEDIALTLPRFPLLSLFSIDDSISVDLGFTAFRIDTRAIAEIDDLAEGDLEGIFTSDLPFLEDDDDDDAKTIFDVSNSLFSLEANIPTFPTHDASGNSAFLNPGIVSVEDGDNFLEGRLDVDALAQRAFGIPVDLFEFEFELERPGGAFLIPDIDVELDIALFDFEIGVNARLGQTIRFAPTHLQAELRGETQLIEFGSAGSFDLQGDLDFTDESLDLGLVGELIVETGVRLAPVIDIDFGRVIGELEISNTLIDIEGSIDRTLLEIGGELFDKFIPLHRFTDTITLDALQAPALAPEQPGSGGGNAGGSPVVLPDPPSTPPEEGEPSPPPEDILDGNDRIINPSLGVGETTTITGRVGEAGDPADPFEIDIAEDQPLLVSVSGTGLDPLTIFFIQGGFIRHTIDGLQDGAQTFLVNKSLEGNFTVLVQSGADTRSEYNISMNLKDDLELSRPITPVTGPVTGSNEEVISDLTADDQRRPDVAGIGTGGAVFVWETRTDSDGDDVHMRTLREKGTTQSEIVLPRVFGDDQQFVSVASNKALNFYVAAFFSDHDDFGRGIYYRRFIGEDNAATVERALVEDDAKQEDTDQAVVQGSVSALAPRAVTFDNGDFGATYVENGGRIFFHRLDSSQRNVVQDTKRVLINDLLRSDAADSDPLIGANLAAASDGDALVAWQAVDGFVYVAEIDRDMEVTIHQVTAANVSGSVSIVALPDGNNLLAWIRNSGGNQFIEAQILNSDFELVGSRIDLGQGIAFENDSLARNVDLTVTSGGAVAAVWEANGIDVGDDMDIYGRVLNFDGSFRSDIFLVNQDQSNDQVHGQIDSLLNGGFVTIYVNESGADGDDVVARRFGLINNAPQARDLAAVAAGAGSTSFQEIDLLGNRSDADGDFLFVTELISFDAAIIDASFANDVLTVTPVAGSPSPTTITYRVSDGLLTADFDLHLTFAENDAPVLVLGNVSIDEGGTADMAAAVVVATDDFSSAEQLQISFGGLQNVSVSLLDGQGGASVLSAGQSVSAQQVDDGLVRIDHLGGEELPAMTVTFSDGALQTTLSVEFDVTPVNDAPSALTFPVVSTLEADANGILGTLEISDPDLDDSHDFTLVADSSGVLGVSAEGVVFFTQSIDHLQTNQIVFTAAATDSGGLEIAGEFVVDVLANPLRERIRQIEVGDSIVTLTPNLDRLFGSSEADDITVSGRLVFGEQVDLGSGNDRLRLSDEGNALSFSLVETIVGGAGDDLIHHREADLEILVANLDLEGAQAGAVQIDGGAGNDTLLGNIDGELLLGDSGVDQIDAGGGRDTLVGGQGTDTLNGGAGDDLADYGMEVGGGGIVADLGQGLVVDSFGDQDSLSGIERLGGTENADQIDGGDAPEWLSGGDGDDGISGGAGADTLLGGGGSDTLSGGAGVDRAVAGASWSEFRDQIAFDDSLLQLILRDLSGFQGIDRISEDVEIIEFDDLELGLRLLDNSANVLFGGVGSEILSGFLGNDDIRGNDGDDLIHGGGGGDQLLGNAGADTLQGGLARDTMFGGDDNDSLLGGEDVDSLRGDGGNDIIFGGDITDFLIGNDGDDTIFGGTGNDRIQGDAGSDSLVGEDGNDVMAGFAGLDLMFGGDGVDRMDGGLDADFLDGGAGGDIVQGREGNDTVFGGSEQDQLFGGDGDDLIQAGTGNDIVRGDAGDDTLEGQGGGNVIKGGTGNDLMTGAEGIDIMEGEDDNDTLDGALGNDRLFGQAGSDRLFGGGGVDRLDGGIGDDSLDGGLDDDAILGGDGLDTLLGGDGDDQLFGQADNDQLFGGDGADRMDAGSGDNLLSGGAGNDTLIGRSGNDTLAGDDDNDRIFGIDGADSMSGGAGIDTLLGGIGNDTIAGDAGDDQLFGEDGSDSLYGGEGADRIDSGLGDDVAAGGIGNDTVIGRDGADTLSGDAGDDRLFAGPGNDFVSGDAGNDHLVGEGGHDALQGGEGDDLLEGRDGNDEVLGGAGLDTLFGGAGDDQLFGEDDDDILVGGDGADRLDAGAGDNLLSGGTGDDTLIGRTGADTLQGGDDDDRMFGIEGADSMSGGNGADFMLGGIGNDTMTGDRNDDQVFGEEGNDSLDGGNGDDRIDGGTGNDVAAGGSGADTVIGRDGADTLSGDAGDDLLFAGLGDDSASGGADNDRLVGEAGNDSLRGDSGNDLLEGRDDDDLLFGGDGDDQIQGDAGNDLLDGGLGVDLLSGGSGNDTLTGGGGADEFRFFSGDGVASADIVTDFETGTDSFRLFSLTVQSVADADVDSDTLTDDTLVTLSNGATVGLIGVTGLLEDDLF